MNVEVLAACEVATVLSVSKVVPLGRLAVIWSCAACGKDFTTSGTLCQSTVWCICWLSC